jgi:tetratricopeptide (TPR) repeat protein
MKLGLSESDQSGAGRLALAVAEFGKGDIAGSISDLQQGVKDAPDNALTYYDLSLAHTGSGKMEEARKDLEESLHYEPTSRAYCALCPLLLLDGKYDEAAATYKKAIEMAPNSNVAWANLGGAYGWNGKQEEAVPAFRKAVELEELQQAEQPMNPELMVTLASAYAQIGNAVQSLTLNRQALAIGGNNPKVAYIAGETTRPYL